MRRINTYVLLTSAIGLTAFFGVLHGSLTDRWGSQEDTQRIADRLRDFPAELGSWTMAETLDLSPTVQEMLQCRGFINRQYVHQVSGQAVSVFVVLGPTGPISVHTPDVCYSSVQYRVLGSRQAVTIQDAGGGRTEFWAATLESTRMDKSLLRVHYAWSSDGRWTAPENPRFSCAGLPYLLKIQVAASLPAGSDPAQNDPGEDFLEDFIPVFIQHVFASTES